MQEIRKGRLKPGNNGILMLFKKVLSKSCSLKPWHCNLEELPLMKSSGMFSLVQYVHWH